jgi:hypothetical protein
VTTVFRLLLALALAFSVTMALLPSPPQLVDAGDKWQHMAAFATLALLGAGAFPDEPLPRIGERLSFLGALIEVAQSIPALHRDCDVMDWVADTAAIAVALLLAAAARSLRAGRAAP